MLFSLFFFVSSAWAMETVWPLQFHCGVQNSGGRALAYGLLVYEPLDSRQQEEQRNEVAYFQMETDGAWHPFCDVLDKALIKKRALRIEVEQGDLKRLVRIE